MEIDVTIKKKELIMNYDLIFNNLKIIDGTGNPYYFGDIGIKDDIIVKIGTIVEKNVRNIDCKGLIASPGFIDIHSHAEYTIMHEPTALSYISQGVTSLVIGNCGETLAPVNKLNYKLYGRKINRILGIKKLSFEYYLDILDDLDKSINILPLAAHGNIRSAVVGCEDVQISEKNIEEMKLLLRKAMNLGAFGLSTGLIYDPGIFAKQEELVEFAKIVKEYDGMYTTHMRNESNMVIEAMLEAINIGKETDVNVELSHLKASGKQNHGLSRTMLGLISYYRQLGLNISCDAYPSIYCKTSLVSCLPPWTRAEGLERLREIINCEKATKKITEELKLPGIDWENLIMDAGLDDIRISNTNNDELKSYINKSILEIAEELDIESYETVYYLLNHDISIGIIAGGVSEEDNINIILNETTSICSDGLISSKKLGNTHPRSYIAFTKMLAHFVRDSKLITIENAVRKMTSMPARKLGLQDRGILMEGFKADIAIFNYNNLKYNSTFKNPHALSNGMEYVLVNGKIVLKNEKPTNVFSGKLLRKTRY